MHKVFIATAELVIPTGTLTAGANAEIEIRPITKKASVQHNYVHVF